MPATARLRASSSPGPPVGRRHIFESALEQRSLLRLQACIFGGDDFCASLGLKREPGTGWTLGGTRVAYLCIEAGRWTPTDCHATPHAVLTALCSAPQRGAPAVLVTASAGGLAPDLQMTRCSRGAGWPFTPGPLACSPSTRSL